MTPDLIISGIGVTTAIGQGKAAFLSALLEGKHRFDRLKRPGRQIPKIDIDQSHDLPDPFLGAEIPTLLMPSTLDKRLLRTASFSAQVALATLSQAWEDAQLAETKPERIGLIIGGSNVQQRDVLNTQLAYQNQVGFLRPSYGLTFMDSDLSGLATQMFGIKGLAYTVGGASASGQLAVIQAMQAIWSGQVDVCIALGALMDLSYWELQAFRALGAMGSERYAAFPAQACRPFDTDRDGFIYGEACGAVVIEKKHFRSIPPHAYGLITGWAVGMDANRYPNPSCQGQIQVIQTALERAGLTGQAIDYVNPHGTGSVLGDSTELEALTHCGLTQAAMNTTKSLVGHGLTAAGTVELIATLLQMQAGQLHPSRNLLKPIQADCQWTGQQACAHSIHHALTLSIGFGGINTALIVRHG